MPTGKAVRMGRRARRRPADFEMGRSEADGGETNETLVQPVPQALAPEEQPPDAEPTYPRDTPPFG